MPQAHARAATARLTTLTLLVSLAACATVAPAASWAGAALEVANRHAEPLVVSVRGRVEGTVQPNARLRIRHLSPGPAAVEAAPRERSVGAAPRERAEVTLAEGATTLWVLGDAEVGPLPLPLTTLEVANPTARNLVVSLDERRLGRVFAGNTRIFGDLPAGPHAIEAVSDDGAVRVGASVTLSDTAPNRWEAATVGAALEVLNDSGEAVHLFVDGDPRGRVEAAGAYRSATERAGTLILRAEGVRTRRPYEGIVEAAVGATARWRLTGGEASVRIDNGTAEALDVRVRGGEPQRVEAGDTCTFEGVAAGEVRLDATGADSGLRYAARAALAPGQTYRWTPTPPTPTLRIDNRTSLTLHLYLGGRARDRIAPHTTAVIAQLPPQRFEAELVDDRASVRFSRTVDPAAAPATTWSVAPVVGGVRVDNHRPETVDVYVDGRFMGNVAAREALTFTNIPVGDRLVEVTGKRSGATLRETVGVEQGQAATVALDDPTATLEVSNDLGVPVTPTGLLADQRRQLLPGTSATFTIPAAAATYSVLAGRIRYATTVRPGEGESVSWTVRPQRATLRVWNRLDEAIAVAVDDVTVGSVEAGRSAAFDDVASGEHRLHAVGMDSGRVRHAVRVAEPGGALSWTVATAPGRVIVSNESAERVYVSIDGEPYGHVDARSSLAFAGVWPGERTIAAVGEASGARQVFTASLRDGESAAIGVHAPMGVVLLDNRTGAGLEVLVDGAPAGAAPAGASAVPIPAPAGNRRVEAVFPDRSRRSFSVQVKANMAVHLPVAPQRARLVVVNRAAAAREVYLDDALLGQLPAGSSAMYEDVAIGRRELRAQDGKGRVTHVGRQQIRAGETATWVLAAP